METGNEINILKKSISELRERRSSIKAELSVKEKHLEATKKELQEKLDEHGISYKNLDETIEKMESELDAKIEQIKADIRTLSDGL